MVPFVLLEHAEEHLRTPAQLPRLALPAREIPRHHQPSLRDAAKLPFHQLRSAQCRVQIVLCFGAAKTTLPLRERQFLKAAEREKKTIIVDRDEGVAADPILHPPGDDSRECVVRASADERVEKIMRMFAFAIQLDEKLLSHRHLRDRELRAKKFHDRLRVRDRDLIRLDQPIDRCFVPAARSRSIEIGAQLPHRMRQAGGQRHFRRVPARNGWQLSVGAFDISFLHAGLDQPNNPAAEDKKIAHAQLFDESFLDRAEPAPAEQDADVIPPTRSCRC